MTTVYPKYDDDESFYGFFLNNILKSLINDMYSSGDAEGYLSALASVMEDLEYYTSVYGDASFDAMKELWDEG